MKTEKYHHVKSESGKCADDHFACMTLGACKTHDLPFQKKMRFGSQRHLIALEVEFASLGKRETTQEVTRRIALIRELQTPAQRDLFLLSEL